MKVLLVVPSLNVEKFKGLARVSLELKNGLESRGIDVETYEVHKDKKNYLKNLTTTPFRELTAKANIIHAVTPESATFLWLVKKVRNVKTIVTFHDLIPIKYADELDFQLSSFVKLYTNFMWKNATKTDVVTAVSKRTAEDVEKFFKRKVDCVINPGIDEKFRETRRHNLSNKKITLGFFANFSYRKGVDKAIEVFKIIRQKVDAKLIIAGGSLQTVYQRQFDVKKLIKGIENDVEIKGYIPDDEIVDLYNSFDFYLFPSSTEGFGIPILEAQACMPADEVIVTKNEVKPINKIKVGDELLLSKVIKTFSRNYKGKLVTIKPKGLLPRKFTADHLIMTDKGWKKAGELTTDDYVAVPRLPSINHIDPKLARFYGIYVGDGYMEHGAIVLCPNGEQQAREWAHLCIDVFGGAYIQKKQYKVKVPKRLSFDVSEKTGKKAKNKRIPVDILFSTTDAKIAFLRGLIESDGYVHESREKLRIVIITTSRGLIEDLVLLLASLGIHASISIKRHTGKGTIQGRNVNLNEAYVLYIYGNDASFILGKSRKFKYRRLKRGYTTDSYLFYKIEEIEKKPFEGKVHNFQTSNSIYTVPFIVHNCGVPTLIFDKADIPEETREKSIKCSDVRDMANKILWLIDNKEEYVKISREGKEYAKQFTWDKFVDEHVRMYEWLTCL